MRYILSDPHGEYDLFRKLLEKIRFSDQDEMIICGDILDKGPNPIHLAKYVRSKPNIRCIMGNHEYQFLKFYWSLMRRSPKNFDEVLTELQGYHPNDGYLLDWDIIDWLEGLPLYAEEQEYICVHAGVPLTEKQEVIPLQEISVEQLIYDRLFKEPFVLPRNDKCIFFGHTPTNYITGKDEIITYSRVERPQKLTDYYKIHLDTGASMTGIMGCFCLDTLKCIYVSK